MEVLQKCFPDELTESAWLPKLRQIIPTYGIDLKADADACRRIRAETAAGAEGGQYLTGSWQIHQDSRSSQRTFGWLMPLYRRPP